MEDNHSLTPIGYEEKTLSTLDVAALWAGINICLPSFMLGAILVPALSWWQALAVTIIGNSIIFLLTYWMALPGTDRGWSSVLMSRRVFGYPYGSLLPSLGIIASMIGWSAVMLSVTGLAVNDIVAKAFHYNNPTLFIIITGLVITLTSLAGKKGINMASLIQVPALVILLGWILYILAVKFNLPGLVQFEPSGTVSLAKGFDWVIGGSIAGVFVASDLGRFARGRSEWGWGALWGIIPVNIGLAILGILSQLATGDWNPVKIIGTLDMGIPALLLLVFSAWTTNQVCLYSGGLAVFNILPRAHRLISTLVLGVLAILLALSNYLEKLSTWLVQLSLMFGPMLGVALVYIACRSYELPQVNRFEWGAILALVAGIAAGKMSPDNWPVSIISTLAAAVVYAGTRQILKALHQ
ncbi:MAG: purine-cytosine permease family protein [Acidobacteriota bacterium]